MDVMPKAPTEVRVGRRTTSVAGLAVGTGLLAQFGALAVFVLDPGLGQVDPTSATTGLARGGRPVDVQIAVVILLVTLATLVVGVVPTVLNHGTMRRLGQFVSGLLVLATTVFVHALLRATYFAGPDETCNYPSCWPLPYQSWAAMVPGIALGAALLAMSLIPSRRVWPQVVPAVVWPLTVLVQRLLWDGALLSLFSSPPP